MLARDSCEGCCKTYQRTVKVFHGNGRVWILFTRGVGGGKTRHGCTQTHHASAQARVAGRQGGQVRGIEAGELGAGAGVTRSCCADLGVRAEAGLEAGPGLGGQGEAGGRQPRGQRRGDGGRLLRADGRHVRARHGDVGRRRRGARCELKVRIER